MTFSDTNDTPVYQKRLAVSSRSYTGRSRPADPAPTIVVYHHVACEKHALTSGLGVRVHLEILRSHLSYFARNYDIISLSDLIGARLPKRPLLITFDDLYRSVLDVAGPLLRDIRAPSLLFLNPSYLLGPLVPMDNLLACAVSELGAPLVQAVLGLRSSRAATTSQIIEHGLSRLGSAQIQQAREALVAALGRTEKELRRDGSLFLGEDDVLSLARYGIDVGNHSMNHRFFRNLSSAELADEITDGRKALEMMSGRPVHALSIPYGNERDATHEVLGVARSSGHKAIFLVHGRSNHRQAAPDLYYRSSLKQSPAFMLPMMLGGLPKLRSYLTGPRPSAHRAARARSDQV